MFFLFYLPDHLCKSLEDYCISREFPSFCLGEVLEISVLWFEAPECVNLDFIERAESFIVIRNESNIVMCISVYEISSLYSSVIFFM